MKVKITIKDCTITEFEELVKRIKAIEKQYSFEDCTVEVELIHSQESVAQKRKRRRGDERGNLSSDTNDEWVGVGAGSCGAYYKTNAMMERMIAIIERVVGSQKWKSQYLRLFKMNMPLLVRL